MAIQTDHVDLQLIEEIILNGVLDSSAKEALAWSLLAFLGTDKGDKFR